MQPALIALDAIAARVRQAKALKKACQEMFFRSDALKEKLSALSSKPNTDTIRLNQVSTQFEASEQPPC